MVASMSKLVAIAYPDEATAGEVAQTLMERQLEHHATGRYSANFRHPVG